MPVSAALSDKLRLLQGRLFFIAVGFLTGMLLVYGAAVQAWAAPVPESFAQLAQQVTPAVVNISATRLSDRNAPMVEGLPFDFEGTPFEEFFRRFQEQVPERRLMTALGSGFIIDPAGYIATNVHVVDRAEEVEITLNDGRTFPARVIGSDDRTDIALLKIDAKSLPYVSFGDSDALQVGDWILAVGNPFGLGGSVTAGIISARSRDIQAGPFDDFLQTDAAINSGNSGGPMFNAQGQVVGINTAIASPTGGSVGIGFAIPSNMAKTIVTELRERGRVERGWLGVQIQTVTPEIAAAVGLDQSRGALVSNIVPNSPAAAAGIQQGDIILSYQGQDITAMRSLPRLVADTRPGQRVPVVVLRDGERRTIQVEIAPLADEQAETRAPSGEGDQSSSQMVLFGAELAPLSASLRSQYDIPSGTKGVLVINVDPASAAARQGLREGDVISEVSRQHINTPQEVMQAVERARQNNQTALLLLVNRGGNEMFIAIRLNGRNGQNPQSP